MVLRDKEKTVSDERERKMVALIARLEGQSVALKNTGDLCKVSETELVCLCNMAHLGCLSLFLLDEGSGAKAGSMHEAFLRAVNEALGDPGQANGLYRLLEACVAILGQDRLGQYVIPTESKETP
jgi:hypothetical protein